MPRQPVYATAALGQPLAQAGAAADAIVARNMVQ
jgi:membrane fusion protein (multidrug efflux system)